MDDVDAAAPLNVTQQRALESCGTSGDAIHRAVVRELTRLSISGTLYDIGCGAGRFRDAAKALPFVTGYVGVDIVRYDSFPADANFLAAPLDQIPWPIADGVSDLTCCIETIEHLENPRALLRELKRITKPGGVVIVTTPNNLSLLSQITLLTKGQFNSFQEAPGLYPSHITALLAIDLKRIATECGLIDPQIRYSDSGRLPGTARSWPTSLGMRGKWFSDNVLLIARR